MNATPSYPDSSVTVYADSPTRIACYSGQDATRLARAKVLMSAIRMHVQTGGRMRLTRVATPTNMLKIAAEFSGKTYKRGQFSEAYEDVKKWAIEMEAALPVEVRK